MKNLIKIFTSIILIATIFFATSKTPSADTRTTVTGSVSVQGCTYDYYYSDTFFATDPHSIFWPLAKISCVLSAAAAEAGAVSSMYSEMGFYGIEQNDGYTGNDKADNVGLSAAHKQIRINGVNHELICLTARGVNYRLEWASNFDVGKSGDHKGFDTNADRLVSFLSDYKEKYDLDDDTLIWMQGYSRGGTIAYLAANKLIESGYDEDNLCVYTFSAPNGTVNPKPIKTVFNIVNSMDIIQRMFPEDWGFGRHGTTITVGSPDKASSLPSVDTAHPGLIYGDRTFSIKRINKSSLIGIGGVFEAEAKTQYGLVEYYDKLISFLENDDSDFVNEARASKDLSPIRGMCSREVFCDEYADSFGYFLQYLYGNESGFEDFTESFEQDAGSLIFDFALDAVSVNQDYDKTIEGFNELLKKVVPNRAVPDKEHMRNLLRLFGRLIRKDFGKNNASGIKTAELPITSTLFAQTDYIFCGHMPATVLAWLEYEHPETYCALDVEVAGNIKKAAPNVIGESMVKPGDSVELVATYISKDFKFLGWYDGETLISDEEIHTVTVDSDMTITARFEELPDPTPTNKPRPTEEENRPTVFEDNDDHYTPRKKSSTSLIKIILICTGSAIILAGAAVAIIVITKKRKK